MDVMQGGQSSEMAGAQQELFPPDGLGFSKEEGAGFENSGVSSTQGLQGGRVSGAQQDFRSEGQQQTQGTQQRGWSEREAHQQEEGGCSWQERLWEQVCLVLLK